MAGGLTIYANDIKLYNLVDYASTVLNEDFNLETSIVSTSSQGTLSFTLNATADNAADEAYGLIVDKGGVKITSSTETGLFYGVQTLRQLIQANEDMGMIPGVTIMDAPRFGWRAFMLDEGRYFQGKEQVKKLLDEMARLKMNIFHWHLVDDQGWRIEIKKYPLLTTVGSSRESTQVGPLKWKSPIQSGVVHAGYYTQEDIREIVIYAQERHITVVPEIEMPGHSSAAIAAYPWLGSAAEEIDVPIWFGVSKDVYDITNPKVLQFLTDILDEVMELFPSTVIHIGGDEVKYDHWKNADHIRKYMEQQKIKTPADLQIAFTNRISQYLESKNRKMMGWNEIMGHNVHDYQANESAQAEKELSRTSVIHFWKGDIELMTNAATNGFDIVNSLNSETYLDYSYDDISLERAYNFDPVPLGLDARFHDKILGLGCQMWGEWIPTSGYMDFQTFPRIAAYAEVGWTKLERKNFDEFLNAMNPILKIWEDRKIYHAPLDVSMNKK